MKKAINILFVLFLLLAGCEDIYIADLDNNKTHLVVEAKLNADQYTNYVNIYKTVGFYDEEDFPPVTDAEVLLIDNENNITQAINLQNGEYKILDSLKSENLYKIQILYDNETYESDYEPVPEIPGLDTVYGEPFVKDEIIYDNNGKRQLKSYDGFRFFADIKNDEKKYYRFDSRQVRLSNYPVQIAMMGIPTVVTFYAWKSFYPNGGYNIAAPNEYSSTNNITKHSLDFINADFLRSIDSSTGETERAWIYIIKQYGISVSAYQYFKDLNKQLESEGKIFDPIYSQTYGNIKSTSNNEKEILGNFEIESYREYRYFLKILNYENEYKFERIDDISVNIPISGVSKIYPPEWWIF